MNACVLTRIFRLPARSPHSESTIPGSGTAEIVPGENVTPPELCGSNEHPLHQRTSHDLLAS
jgi:hypothetical protein